ncbi:MAG: replication-relaxation family protein [Chloroflexi bacterium]|nr:replication-relaxation family protein [Chloroflexota bacterium]
MPDKNKSPRPKFTRAENPPPLRIQSRDVELMQTIHDYDGVLARRQIKQLFWPDKSAQAMEARLSKLYHNAYLDWPDEHQRRIRPIPEPLVWLGWRGALTISGNNGDGIEYPTSENENQMRTLQVRLRKHGMRWLREPNWNQVRHDLVVIDFRIAVEQSLKKNSQLSLERWIPESVFRANTDRIKFSVKGNNGKTYQRTKGVVPDGFFTIADTKRKANGQPHRARFLLEVDMATHDNPSFGIEKAAAGAAYIQSRAYRDRFGVNAGRWLVVTTGETRMQNLMRQTKQKASMNAKLFYFTTRDSLQNRDPLTHPIWWQVDKEQPQSLPI